MTDNLMRDIINNIEPLFIEMITHVAIQYEDSRVSAGEFIVRSRGKTIKWLDSSPA